MKTEVRCNFPDISYLSETQKKNFQFLKSDVIRVSELLSVASQLIKMWRNDSGSTGKQNKKRRLNEISGSLFTLKK